MANEHVPEGIDYDDEGEETTAEMLAQVIETQEEVIELIVRYRTSLLEADFSDEAAEMMCVQYHGQLRDQ